MCDLQFQAVVVTYNSAAHIRPCLTSLLQAGVRVVVIDNNSYDETVPIIEKEFPETTVVCAGRNLGYGAALNLGIAKTKSKFVLAANADTMFPAGALQTLAEFLRVHPRTGVAGPQLIFADGRWQRSYGDVPGIYEGAKMLSGCASLTRTAERLAWRFLRPHRPKPAGYVDGAVMMIRREAFDQIGGFDEDLHFYCEDADLCVNMREAGWQVIHVPTAVVFHTRGGSSTKVQGFSDALLNSLVKAECQFIRKHHPDRHVRVYRQLCIWHARKMQLMYRVVGLFRPGRALEMSSAFERWAGIWAGVELQDCAGSSSKVSKAFLDRISIPEPKADQYQVTRR